jgi:hypothetical protein
MGDDATLKMFSGISQVSGAILLITLWFGVIACAPWLGVPILGCISFLATPGLMLMWVVGSVYPADYTLPLGRRAPGALAMLVASVLTMGALVVGLGHAHTMTLAWLRGAPPSPSLQMGAVALVLAFAALTYGAGFSMRWGLHPVLALLAGLWAVSVVPLTCTTLVLMGLMGIPLSA